MMSLVRSKHLAPLLLRADLLFLHLQELLPALLAMARSPLTSRITFSTSALVDNGEASRVLDRRDPLVLVVQPEKQAQPAQPERLARLDPLARRVKQDLLARPERLAKPAPLARLEIRERLGRPAQLAQLGLLAIPDPLAPKATSDQPDPWGQLARVGRLDQLEQLA